MDRYWVCSQACLLHFPSVPLRISPPWVCPQIWTGMHGQGMKTSVPSVPEYLWVTTTLLHMPALGPVAFYFSHVTLRARVSSNTAYGSICRAVPHCHFRPWTLLRKPSQISLGPSTHRSLFSMPSWPPWQKSFFLIAGKSTFLSLVNLVILPTPKNPVHPLEPGESSTSFYLYSDISLPEATFTVPTTYLNKRERERRKYKLMS